MNSIPKGWGKCFLVDLLEPLGDGRPLHQGWSPQCERDASSNNETWGVLKTTAIQNGCFLPEHNKRLPEALKPRPNLEVQNGDILLTCAGPRLRCGVACLVRSTRPKLMLSGKMYRMRVNNQYFDPRYIEAMLMSPHIQKSIDGMKTGISESGMNLTHERFSKLEIPVPPTSEQRRIADKLDALFERSHNIRNKLDRLPRLLDVLKKSILHAAFTGELTREWRRGKAAENAVHPDWRQVRLHELCKPERALTYGVIKLGNHMPDGVPVLRSSNVRHLWLDTSNIKKVAPALSQEYARTILTGHEVLITVRGTLGGVCAVGPEQRGWNVSREVAVIPLADDLNAEYVAMSIASPQSQSWLKQLYKGVAYTGINIADLKNLPIAIPSRIEQDEIVARVRRALEYIAGISGAIKSSEVQFASAESSFLGKAFRGELVPQDPNDEPASVLLERIKAERASSAFKQRGRVRQKPVT